MGACPIKALVPPSKIAIVGAGCVGSTTAYALMLEGVVPEIVLIDVNKEKAIGEAFDLRHCMQFTQSISIEAGDSYELLEQASIVVICAGLPQKMGESRMDLLKKNAEIFKDIIPKITKHNQDCILLVVSNPLDVLTYITLKLSGMSTCRVFGTGTVLDSARLRYLLGYYLKVSPKDITAYVLGEHGDSEFIWWSKANIACTPIVDFPGCSLDLRTNICEKTKNSVYEIIKRKGSTNYAIASTVAKICRAIIQGQSRVFSLSTFIDIEIYGVRDLCLSIPTLIGNNGVCQHLPIDLDEKEQQAFIRSAKKIREGMRAIENLI
jgi:L-lactate dehydrogenase